MKKMLSTIKVTFLTAVILMSALAVTPQALAREVIDIVVICTFGPSNCGITLDPDSGLITSWQIDTIIIFE